MKRRSYTLVAVTAFFAATNLGADIVSDALFTFPAQAEYVEYDNLAALRKLPIYSSLRQNFAGKPLEEAKAALGQLGIQEEQVGEIVTASSADSFYGVISGTFSAASVARKGKAKGYARNVMDTQAFCTGRVTCIVFLKDSLAAFGPVSRLKEMLKARRGGMASLSSSHVMTELLNSGDPRAPVRGALCGSQLRKSVSQLLEEWTGWKRDWSFLSATLSGIGYSVRFDRKTHIRATLDCTSKAAAATMVQMLGAVRALQPATTAAFQNLQVSSSDHLVYLTADADLPGPH